MFCRERFWALLLEKQHRPALCQGLMTMEAMAVFLKSSSVYVLHHPRIFSVTLI